MKKVTVFLISALMLAPVVFASSPVPTSGPVLNYYVVESFTSPYGRFGFGPWTGGTSSPKDASATVIKSDLFGHVWEIYYNVEKKGSYNGTWLNLANTNLSQTFAASPTYSNLVFFVKSDSASPTSFKVELKSPNNGVEYCYVKGVTDRWALVQIPFEAFAKYSWTEKTDFAHLTQMTFVFENDVDPIKTGHIYVADIGFSKSGAVPVQSILGSAHAQLRGGDEVLTQNEKAAAQYFWNEVNPANGLVKDRTTWDSPSSIAAVGFGLTALSLSAEHGWIPKMVVYNRILTTLRYFKSLPNEHGFYYHFLNLWTGKRAFASEVSPIDTTLFIAGALFAGQYFQGTAVQELADELYERINWQWMTNHTAYIAMAWNPEKGFSPSYWTGYSEATLMYLLAIGSPTYPISPSSWEYWVATWSKNGSGELEHWADKGESLFTYLYSQAYVDFRHLSFKYVGSIWENSQRAIEYDIQFAKVNQQYKAFKDGLWGISASDGPSGYKAYGAITGRTDGTIAPYAIIGSLPLVPDQSKKAIMKLWLLRNEIYGRYGFVDAFNLDQNWRDFQYVGIDVGIETLMTENYYTGMVWEYFMQIPYVQKAINLIGAKD